jgi:hypothetical protein
MFARWLLLVGLCAVACPALPPRLAAEVAALPPRVRREAMLQLSRMAVHDESEEEIRVHSSGAVYYVEPAIPRDVKFASAALPNAAPAAAPSLPAGTVLAANGTRTFALRDGSFFLFFFLLLLLCFVS